MWVSPGWKKERRGWEGETDCPGSQPRWSNKDYTYCWKQSEGWYAWTAVIRKLPDRRQERKKEHSLQDSESRQEWSYKHPAPGENAGFRDGAETSTQLSSECRVQEKVLQRKEAQRSARCSLGIWLDKAQAVWQNYPGARRKQKGKKMLNLCAWGWSNCLLASHQPDCDHSAQRALSLRSGLRARLQRDLIPTPALLQFYIKSYLKILRIKLFPSN